MSNHIRICNGPYCRSAYSTQSPERLADVMQHQVSKGNTAEIANVCLQVCARLRPCVLNELDEYGQIEAHVLVDDDRNRTFSGVVLRVQNGNLINKKV